MTRQTLSLFLSASIPSLLSCYPSQSPPLDHAASALAPLGRLWAFMSATARSSEIVSGARITPGVQELCVGFGSAEWRGKTVPTDHQSRVCGTSEVRHPTQQEPKMVGQELAGPSAGKHVTGIACIREAASVPISLSSRWATGH